MKRAIAVSIAIAAWLNAQQPATQNKVPETKTTNTQNPPAPTNDGHVQIENYTIARINGEPVTLENVLQYAWKYSSNQLLFEYMKYVATKQEIKTLGIENLPADLTKRAEAHLKQIKANMGTEQFNKWLAAQGQGMTEAKFIENQTRSDEFNFRLALERALWYHIMKSQTVDVEVFTYKSEQEARDAKITADTKPAATLKLIPKLQTADFTEDALKSIFGAKEKEIKGPFSSDSAQRWYMVRIKAVSAPIAEDYAKVKDQVLAKLCEEPPTNDLLGRYQTLLVDSRSREDSNEPPKELPKADNHVGIVNRNLGKLGGEPISVEDVLKYAQKYTLDKMLTDYARYLVSTMEIKRLGITNGIDEIFQRGAMEIAATRRKMGPSAFAQMLANQKITEKEYGLRLVSSEEFDTRLAIEKALWFHILKQRTADIEIFTFPTEKEAREAKIDEKSKPLATIKLVYKLITLDFTEDAQKAMLLEAKKGDIKGPYSSSNQGRWYMVRIKEVYEPIASEYSAAKQQVFSKVIDDPPSESLITRYQDLLLSTVKIERVEPSKENK